MWGHLKEAGHWQGEVWNRRQNGEVFPEWLTINAVYDSHGEVTNYIGIFTDITGLKRTQERLEFLAHHDTLTELPNRTLFEYRLEKAIAHSHRHDERIAVLIIDLDRFKAINDSLGHAVGDELLTSIPERLALRLRAEDTFARLGGDEFGVLLSSIGHAEDAERVARDILQRLSAPFSLPSGHEVFIGASIGISVFPDDGSSPSEMMRNADSAMYAAKASGRNTCRFYTEELTRHAQARLSLENRLRRALDQGEFELHYQPFVRINDEQVVGAEALLRWRDPEHGLIAPGEFIEVAEDSGLIARIGGDVLQMACRQMRAWQDAGLPLPALAANLSPQQFLLQDVPALVEQALNDHGLPGHRLAIDDFGTSYSSLAYLQQFPLDKLKVDQRFVRDLDTNDESRELATAIITMGHGLRMEVLAEGVETEAQLRELQCMGCDTYQGWLVARPQPVEAVAAWLRARKAGAS